MSESTDVFVITPNRRTFFFPETEHLNFGDLVMTKTSVSSDKNVPLTIVNNSIENAVEKLAPTFKVLFLNNLVRNLRLLRK